MLGAQVYASAYQALYATYDRQRETRRALSVLSPAIALSHWSSALAGTDLDAHRHFADAAEQQRQTLIRKINEDMMVNGAGQGLRLPGFRRLLADRAGLRLSPAGGDARDALGAHRSAPAARVGGTRRRHGVASRAATDSASERIAMNLRDMFLHEWRTRLARPAALASLAAFAAILIYAAISGRIERDARASAIAGHEAQASDAMERWLADLQALETRGAQSGVPPWSASPMDLEFPSSLPPAPLADFAIGQADLLPSAGKLSLWDPDVRLFSRYEFEDPVSLALGALDLSKAVVLLLPLLMIVLVVRRPVGGARCGPSGPDARARRGSATAVLATALRSAAASSWL